MADDTAAAQDTTDAATAGDQSGADQTTTALGGDAAGADKAGSDNGATDDKTDDKGGDAAGADDGTKGEDGKDGKKGEADGTKSEKSGEGDDPAPFDPAKLELPEGMQLDEELMEQFAPLAKDLGLSQEQGQALVAMHTQALQSMHERVTKAFGDTVAGWAETAKTDKEIGGDKYAENVATAVKAIDRFGSPELQKALNETGMGNHPELIRFCLRIGKAISEDAFGPDAGQSGEGGTRSPADVLYDHPSSKKQ